MFNFFQKIISLFINISLIFFIILALLIYAPRCFGITPYSVISGSMEPSIPVGSVVYAKPVEPSSLKIWDVIVFKEKGNDITHRIDSIDYDNKVVVTKGDANDSCDIDPISFAQIHDKYVTNIPCLGYLLEYFKLKEFKIYFCTFIIFLFVYSLIIFIKNNKNKT